MKKRAKGPMQKPKPSQEVLDMIEASKEAKANKTVRKREDFSQAAARIVREATEEK